MSKKRIIISVGAAFALLIVAGGTIFGVNRAANSPERLISLGEKYLLEQNYEQALVQFLKVIEIDPMNPRGYTGAAEAYVGFGRTDDAIAVLHQGLDVTSDESIISMLDTVTVLSDNDKVDGIEKPDVSVNDFGIIAEKYQYGQKLELSLSSIDLLNKLAFSLDNKNKEESFIIFDSDEMASFWNEFKSQESNYNIYGITYFDAISDKSLCLQFNSTSEGDFARAYLGLLDVEKRDGIYYDIYPNKETGEGVEMWWRESRHTENNSYGFIAASWNDGKCNGAFEAYYDSGNTPTMLIHEVGKTENGYLHGEILREQIYFDLSFDLIVQMTGNFNKGVPEITGPANEQGYLPIAIRLDTGEPWWHQPADTVSNSRYIPIGTTSK